MSLETKPEVFGPNRPIRILLVTHTLAAGGAPKVALDLLESLGDKVELRTISYSGGPGEARCRRLGRLDVMVRSIFGERFPIRVAARRFWQILGKSARRWSPDLIYVNSAPALMAVAHLRLWTAPVLLHVHEMDIWLHRCAEEFPDLLRDLPAAYIAVSEAVRDRLVDPYGVDPSRVKVIHPFSGDSKLGSSEPATEKRSGKLTIGGCGTMGWTKGTELWLLMADELRRIMGEDAVRFVWVGATNDERDWEMRESARKLGLSSSIEYVSQTTEPLRYFQDFDVFAATSWEDSCPLVVLENMLLRKPVVCFAGSGGAREEVGDTGVVVDSFSPRLMAEAIAELAGDPERMRELGDAARKRVLSQFTIESEGPKVWEEIVRLASSPELRPDLKIWESRHKQKGRW